jgi:hypothetical protein
MPRDAHKAGWHFAAMWVFPIHMVGSASLTERIGLLKELDSALKHVCRIQVSALVERSTLPTYNSYVEQKNKLSGLEVTRTSPTT